MGVGPRGGRFPGAAAETMPTLVACTSEAAADAEGAEAADTRRGIVGAAEPENDPPRGTHAQRKFRGSMSTVTVAPLYLKEETTGRRRSCRLRLSWALTSRR